MSRARIVLAVCLLAAAACTDGRSDRTSGRTPPVTPQPSASPSVQDAGYVDMTTVRVSSRAELVAEVNALGFDEVMVLRMGRPVRIEHYTVDHLHVRSFYKTKTGEVRLFQSNDQGITSGLPVMIRGYHGVKNGDGASWVERDYILDLNPLDRRYVRALRWVERRGGTRD